MSQASTDATRRAVRDLLAHGLRGDLAHSALGVELGQHLQSALTHDTGEGASVGQLIEALRDEAGLHPMIYARLLELALVASLDELQVLTDLPASDIAPRRDEVPEPPPRRPARRRPR